MRNRTEFSAFERTLIVVFSFVFFAAIGFVVCIGFGALGLLPNENFLLEAVPFMLGFGATASVLAYRYPKVFEVVLWFFP